MDIFDYGFDPATLSPAGAAEDGTSLIPARTVSIHRERYELVCEHGECFGRLKSGVYYGGGQENSLPSGIMC